MSTTLPYRTDADDIARFLDALARGRQLDQIQTLNYSKKAFEGTVTAAQELGLVLGDGSELSPLGRRFALADERERKAIMLEALRGHEPYGLLLEALASRDEAVTATDWIEAWWSTHGFGSSGSNRSEGSTAFARLLEYVELGSYYQGRRGHPSRVEWRPGALKTLARSTAASAARVDGPEAPAVPELRPAPPQVDVQPREREVAGEDEAELRLPLNGGRRAYIRLPATVTAKEKTRILTLLELMIATGDPGQNEEGGDN
jgi:hypothetical protein